MEVFQTSQFIYPILYGNDYEFNLGIFESSEPDLIADTVSLWISNIEKVVDTLSITVKINSHIPLKGLQFQLQHVPYSKVDTVKNYYLQSISSYEGNNLFEDITLFPYEDFPDTDEKLVINYAYNLSTLLDFDSLREILQNKDINLSHEFSHLVMHIDKTHSEIHDEGMFLHLGYNDTLEQYITFNTYYISSSLDSMILPIGEILRGFQNGHYGDFTNFILKTDGELYNYSKLVILNNPTQSEGNNNPNINLMFWE